MIKIYKTDPKGTINEIKNVERNCWVNITDPNEMEIKKLSTMIGIEETELKGLLDEEERARTEIEDNYGLIVLDVPAYEKHNNSMMSITIPIIILRANDYIFTMCSRKTDIFNDFIKGNVKNFYTEKKSRFTIQIMLKIASRYIKDLKTINEEVNKSENSLKRSTNNNDLLKLMQLQKSLVYFSTSLRSNAIVLEYFK